MNSEDYSELEKKTIESYDRNAELWASEHAVTSDRAELIEYWTRKYFNRDDLVLEIGCGGGRDAVEILKNGLKYFGTDASAGLIEVAKATVPEADFECLNVFDLHKLSQKFDGFWSNAVLLHIPRSRIHAALRQINIVLRTGAVGVIIIKDGDKDDFEVRDVGAMHEERLFVYWQKDDFSAVLQECGFATLKYTYEPISARTNWHVFIVRKVDDLA